LPGGPVAVEQFALAAESEGPGGAVARLPGEVELEVDELGPGLVGRPARSGEKVGVRPPRRIGLRVGEDGPQQVGLGRPAGSGRWGEGREYSRTGLAADRIPAGSVPCF